MKRMSTTMKIEAVRMYMLGMVMRLKLSGKKAKQITKSLRI